MAANTGPDAINYSIPEVELADTFNTWRDITNTQTYKLNKLKVYEGVSSSSITVTTSGGGTLQAVIADNVDKGITFQQPILFNAGVTFNGDVTFNAQTFTVNANNVTIDDYAVVLGETAGTTDSTINTAGGGGLLLKRGSGNTAAWLWTATSVQGLTGVWNSNAHIGLCGASAGLYPHLGGVLPVHGTGIRLDGNASGAHGLGIDLTNGTNVNSVIQLSRYSPTGSTAFAEVLSGSTYGTRPFMKINDGVNRKTVVQASPPHGFWFGAPVRFNGTQWVLARASDETSAEVAGIVSNVINSTTFEITFIGEIFGNFASALAEGSQLTPGSTYYLSPFVSGKITSQQPTASGNVHKAVLIATGTNSAIVLPFTGGLLTSTLNVTNSASIGTRINQVNRFTVGDIVRFKGGSQTLRYNVGNGLTLEGTYSNGVYVKAQANTPEEAEVAGMVIAVDLPVYYPGGAPGATAYRAFDVLMDGWFSGLPATANLIPGRVYFLNTNVAGSSGALESPTSSYTPTQPSPPPGGSIVVKPLFMATTTTDGYLYSYRGDSVSATSGTLDVDIADILIKDVRIGITGDLAISVYNTASQGKESITIATGNRTGFSNSVGITTGYVGIGGNWSLYGSGNSSQNRIMANLDVNGTIRAGVTLQATPQGQDLLVVRNTGDALNGLTMESQVVIGTRHTTANLVLCRDVRPDPRSIGFISSNGAAGRDRSVLELGVSGTDPAFIWKIAENNGAALGTAVPMTDIFSIVGVTATMAGSLNVTRNLAVDTNVLFVDAANNRVGVNTSAPTVALNVVGDATVSGIISGATLSLTQKATSAATVAGDSATTLTTKGYVDSVSVTSQGTAVSLAANNTITTPFSIPASAKRIYIRFHNVVFPTTTGALQLQVVQSGSSDTVLTSGYIGVGTRLAGGNLVTSTNIPADRFTLSGNTDANTALTGMITIDRSIDSGTLNLSGLSQRSAPTNPSSWIVCGSLTGPIVNSVNTLANAPIKLKFFNSVTGNITSGSVHVSWQY